MNGQYFVIQNSDVKSFDEAYVYGTYSAMSWLQGQIIELRERIKNNGPVQIEGHGVCETVSDLKNWVGKKFPELIREIQWG